MKTKAWAIDYNKQLRPITKAQKKYHLMQSAKYIFVHDKDGNATCSCCEQKVNVGHTKHKSEVVCPNCAKKLTVQHTWRMSKYLEVINWLVIPKVIDDYTICLRYILAYARGNNPIDIHEAARLYISEKKKDAEYYWCNSKGEWNKGKGTYFRIPCALVPNKFWCLNATEYMQNFFKEINKLDCFKYYSAEKEYDFHSYSSQLIYMIHAARLNEKLYKVGLDNVANYHRHYFIWHKDTCYKFNNKATNLIDMLMLDRARYNVLKKSDSYQMLCFLQNHPNLNIKNFEMAEYNTLAYETTENLSSKLGVSFAKMYTYLKQFNSYWEYEHYLDTLERLKYDIHDTYYSMPKDFRAAEKRITEEYTRRKNEKKDALIKKISDGLRAMPNLQEFLQGSNGLLVYVPESSAELIEEGKNQHHCVGTYVDRVAEGKTNIFFVRRLNDPTASFVTMEICKGDIIQIRGEDNKDITDTTVLDFCKRFADALKAA